jgi:hypothetical protein
MAEYDRSWQKSLDTFELSEWSVTLHSGAKLTIYANSVNEGNDFYVFSLMIAGHPPSLLPVARIPSAVVSDYYSEYVGLTEPPAPGE